MTRVDSPDPGRALRTWTERRQLRRFGSTELTSGAVALSGDPRELQVQLEQALARVAAEAVRAAAGLTRPQGPNGAARSNGRAVSDAPPGGADSGADQMDALADALDAAGIWFMQLQAQAGGSSNGAHT